MEDSKYSSILNFLKYAEIPAELTSTKGNFVSMAQQYKINQKGYLIRDKKLVVKCSERDTIFKEMHRNTH